MSQFLFGAAGPCLPRERTDNVIRKILLGMSALALVAPVFLPAGASAIEPRVVLIEEFGYFT